MYAMNKKVNVVVVMIMAWIFLAVLGYAVVKSLFIACFDRHITFWERAHWRNMWPKD
jgi:uncharacterized membrane protein